MSALILHTLECDMEKRIGVFWHCFGIFVQFAVLKVNAIK